MGALWLGKCPRCAQGDVFKHPATDLRHFVQMNDYCPACNASFQPEPGFYFGAMFVSYAITVAIMATTGLLLWLILDPSTMVYIYSFLGMVLLATPFSYRYSRLIWLYWFGGHTRQRKP